MINVSSQIPSDISSSFDTQVALKYQIYGGLFLSLPFKDLDQAGVRLSIFAERCSAGLALGDNPLQIVEKYLSRVNIPEERKIELLFKFLQFIERQVVLFDALEDAAFSQVNNLSGPGTLDSLLTMIDEADDDTYHKFCALLDSYKVRVTLTAHPTQFYPDRVLAIILQLGEAIRQNDLGRMRNLFLQMGLTRFRNDSKPTPVDEANSLIWYLEHVFYNNVAKIQAKLPQNNTNLELGFWPGGDRDGNPFVTHDITLVVAKHLRLSILKLYYHDLVNLQYRLTFDGVFEQVLAILHKVKEDQYIESEELIADLNLIISNLDEHYHGLFVSDVASILQKVRLFDFYFVKLDIRQNSHIHASVIADLLKTHKVHDNYLDLNVADKVSVLKANLNNIKLLDANVDNILAIEVLNTIKVIQKIQSINGLGSIERYIISNTETVANIFEVLLLIATYNRHLEQSGIKRLIKLEIVPLFETIDDLLQAHIVMESLYTDDIYKTHLKAHNSRQTIMLGFSDGTKDGGYLMANWAIYMAKKNLSALSKKYGIKVIFFDGRGGPPARGGGNTNDFYRSLGDNIESSEIQLTVQGQTISSNFGTDDALNYNLEQLFTSGIIGKIFKDKSSTMTAEQEGLIEELALSAYDYYVKLRDDPLFVPYLQEITPLKYLSEANVGSRPMKRNQDSELKFADLRAIPFVSSWTQMKQNILGFYGLGHALSNMVKTNPTMELQLKNLYEQSLFFRALVNNAMQSLVKSNFAITEYLSLDPKYGQFWQQIKEEADNTKSMLLLISGQNMLLETAKSKSDSIALREKIILPLLIIQQYAMMKLRDVDSMNKNVYEKLIKKSLAANINANRNSV